MLRCNSTRPLVELTSYPDFGGLSKGPSPRQGTSGVEQQLMQWQLMTHTQAVFVSFSGMTCLRHSKDIYQRWFKASSAVARLEGSRVSRLLSSS